MNGILKKLVQLGCVGIKTSFKDDGVTFKRVHYLRKITSDNGLKLAIKVSGAESMTETKHASEIGADSIFGTIKTGHAAKKFIHMTNGFVSNIGINIETIQALNIIDNIIDNSDRVNYYTINLTSEYQQILKPILFKLKNTGKPIHLYGTNSSDFYQDGLIQYFETRYGIFKYDGNSFEDVLKTSHEFEYEWNNYLREQLTSEVSKIDIRLSLIKPKISKTFKLDKTDVVMDDKLKNISFVNDVDIQSTDYVIYDDFFKFDGFPINAKEYNKTIITCMRIISDMNTKKFNRVVVIGGGITQDVGSFVASIYNRGVSWVFYPTTLLSMADSCIGGKTSINTDVKNKIGTFHPPMHVYINTQFLYTLSDKDILSGLGEIYKLHIIAGYQVKDTKNLKNLIEKSLLIKQSVLNYDMYDTGIRKSLNYGHTIGHAIEIMSDFKISHGEAVILGMKVENKLFGHDEEIPLHVDIPYMNFDKLKYILENDKKTSDGKVGFAVPPTFEIRYKNIDEELCTTIKNILLSM